ncbi:Required for respiratory growth protein 9 mitochondrial [Myotisia sp. PD_48]|nr:Required for respiratory growth protein 9 mitochondrial [Myotisia sp. PD_48]
MYSSIPRPHCDPSRIMGILRQNRSLFKSFLEYSTLSKNPIPPQPKTSNLLHLPQLIRLRMTSCVPSKPHIAISSRHSQRYPYSTASHSAKPEIAVKSNESQPLQPMKPRLGWQIQKKALKSKFKEGWNPRKRLSPDKMETLRKLHKSDPERFSTPFLAEEFKISPEAVRRILKSKWQPSEKDEINRRERWENRKTRIWNDMAELGLRKHKKPSDD